MDIPSIKVFNCENGQRSWKACRGSPFLETRTSKKNSQVWESFGGMYWQADGHTTWPYFPEL